MLGHFSFVRIQLPKPRPRVPHISLQLRLPVWRIRTPPTSFSWPWTNPCWSTSRIPFSASPWAWENLPKPLPSVRSEILVNGKAPGETSLIVWEEGGGRQFFNVIVRPSAAAANDRMEALRRELKTELPEQQVKVSFENGLIFLRGTVKDLTSSDRAVQIASTAGKVVNLLYVNVPSADPQILLKVRFASVDRTLTKQLGFNLFSLGAGNTIGTVGTGQFPIPTVTDTPDSALWRRYRMR